jgi:hypothetical protein
MKTVKLLALLFAFAGFTANAQTTENTTTPTAGTVEKSLFNVQVGAVGAWASHEARLGNKWALRTEVGLDLWEYDTYFDGSGTVLVPSISVEPRWYYNIEKRANKGKYTANNSASFVTVAVEYYPDLFIIGSAPSYIYVPNQMTIIPKWGIRRAIAQSNFNYELGFGVGYGFYFSNSDDVVKSAGDVAIDAHVRIGYTF